MSLHVRPMRVLKEAVIVVMALYMILSVNFLLFLPCRSDPIPPRFIVPAFSGNEYLREFMSDIRISDPLIIQYFDYLGDVTRGDLYTSFALHPGVECSAILRESLPNTLVLFFSALVLSVLIGAALTRILGGRRGPSGSAYSSVVLGLTAFSVTGFAATLLLLNSALDLPFQLSGDWESALRWQHDPPSLITRIYESSTIPILSVMIPSIGLYAVIFRPEARGPHFFRSIAQGFVTRRPVSLFFLSWVMSCALISDIAFRYEGIGDVTFSAFSLQDAPLVMSGVLACALLLFAVLVVASLTMKVVAPAGMSVQMAQDTRVVRPPRSKIDWRAALKSARAAAFGYTKSLPGMAALAVVAALCAVAVFAGQLSTVEDTSRVLPPDQLAILEPPSLSPSPIDGVVHPFGTDNLARDIYSMIVQAVGETLTSVALMVATSTAIGLLLSAAGALSARAPRRFLRVGSPILEAVSLASMSIPLSIFLLSVYLMNEMYRLDGGVILWLGLTAVITLYGWYWSVVGRASDERARSRAKGRLPLAIADALGASKFAVLVGMPLLIMGVAIISWNDTSLLSLIGNSLDIAWVPGAHWGILMPMALAAVVTVSFYVVLGTAENVLRKGADVSSVAQAPRPTVASAETP